MCVLVNYLHVRFRKRLLTYQLFAQYVHYVSSTLNHWLIPKLNADRIDCYMYVQVCDESAFSTQATMTMHIESLHHCTSLLRLYFIYQNPPIPLNEIPYSQKLEVPPELHSELYPKEDRPSFKRLMLGRSGIVLGYRCTVRLG